MSSKRSGKSEKTEYAKPGHVKTGQAKAAHSRGGQVWRDPDGKPVSCVEKIKVLNQNLDEIRQLAQDALEDAILMGCDEAQVRAVLQTLIDDLQNPYRKDK
ncbi:MAG: hypothetical protein ACREEP_19300 [Dongiaceae bacterium]